MTETPTLTNPKRKRRQYGTGGISLRADGRWMGRIDAGYHPNGTRRQVTVYGKTEAEVKAKLDRKRQQIAREGVSISTNTRASVKSWSERWLEQRMRTKRPNTFAGDQTAINAWIVPILGKRKLESLTPADIRALAKAQLDAGLKSSTALRTHRTLIKLLKDAILEGHDVPQRVLLVPAPTIGTNDREALEVLDAVAMLAEAATLPHGSRWATALLQGMRPAECLGLTWKAVDFRRGLITVEWQLQTLRYKDRKNKALGFKVPDGYDARHLVDSYHLVRPKSKKGYRVIPMVPWIREALLAWRELSPENPYDLVWANANGRPANKVHDSDEWDALQCTAGTSRWLAAEQAGTRTEGLGHPAGRWYVPHEARHTTATLLLEAGVDHQVITAILGHSSIVTSRGYMHARTELAAQALGQIAEQLKLAPKELAGTPS